MELEAHPVPLEQPVQYAGPARLCADRLGKAASPAAASRSASGHSPAGPALVRPEVRPVAEAAPERLVPEQLVRLVPSMPPVELSGTDLHSRQTYRLAAHPEPRPSEAAYRGYMAEVEDFVQPPEELALERLALQPPEVAVAQPVHPVACTVAGQAAQVRCASQCRAADTAARLVNCRAPPLAAASARPPSLSALLRLVAVAEVLACPAHRPCTAGSLSALWLPGVAAVAELAAARSYPGKRCQAAPSLMPPPRPDATDRYSPPARWASSA